MIGDTKMSRLTQILSAILIVVLMPLALWLAIAFAADERGYAALARSGLLLIGLASMAWGVLRNRPAAVGWGLVLVTLGFVTFLIDESAIDSARDAIYRLSHGWR